jgi:hypothetical protein
MNRRGFLRTLCLTAGRSFAAALLAPRIACAGICRRCTTRERLYSGLAQKGQTQQQKSDCEKALHEQANSVSFTSSLAKCKLCRFLAAMPFGERKQVNPRRLEETPLALLYPSLDWFSKIDIIVLLSVFRGSLPSDDPESGNGESCG